MFELHVSQINTYNACPRMYRYQYVDCLTPKIYDHKLFLGTGVHFALANYYSGNDPLVAFNTWVEEELAKLPPNTDPETLKEFEKDADLGRALITHYVPWAQANDAFNVLAVEQEFVIPIRNPKTGRRCHAVYAGKFDGIAEDVYGNIWLMEHKTYSKIPSESELRLDSQAGYYLVAAQEVFPNKRVLGVIYTILRKVHPAKAKSEVIYRTQVLRNGCELALLQRRLYEMYRIIRSDKLFIPTPGFHCGWMCRYRQLCIAEEDGSDAQELVNALYDKTEQKSVLTACVL